MSLQVMSKQGGWFLSEMQFLVSCKTSHSGALAAAVLSFSLISPQSFISIPQVYMFHSPFIPVIAFHKFKHSTTRLVTLVVCSL